MGFFEVLTRVTALLREGRVSYRAIQREWHLDDASFDDLKAELIEVRQIAVDHDGLDALKHLLLRESQVQPLGLVFEDLHWIGTETQALLDSLVASLPTARILLLVNYRPEYRHGWGSKTSYTQLRLDPLPPERAEELLQALLGDAAGRIVLSRDGTPTKAPAEAIAKEAFHDVAGFGGSSDSPSQETTGR